MTARHGGPPLGSAARDATAPPYHGKRREPETFCDEGCIHGGTCTLPAGHHGQHEAWGLSSMRCSWPNAARSQADPDPDRCPSCGHPYDPGQQTCCGLERTEIDDHHGGLGPDAIN